MELEDVSGQGALRDDKLVPSHEMSPLEHLHGRTVRPHLARLVMPATGTRREGPPQCTNLPALAGLPVLRLLSFVSSSIQLEKS